MLRDAQVLREGGLYDIQNVAVIHHVQQSLRAHTRFTRDVDYIVRGGKVIIIDEFTGRMMDGRRYSDGLHQALEAKEHVEIQQENQTLASITFQNYFRLYPRLSGMTGTAMTEADEFADIYKLEVIEIPTNRPVSRKDDDDEVYLTAREKYEAVSALVEDVSKSGQPVLVGTTSIEKSELLSALLHKRGVRHNVLNARFHEMEATIVAQAGAPGAITIATNMAGRGTDIKLGGNVEMRIAQELGGIEDQEERARKEAELRRQVSDYHDTVQKAGGLYVIGTERHESRRIDNQLRGRAGRQGDPGNSRFFISLEDDLMRIFGTDRMGGMLQKMGLKEGEAIVHPWINKALERAQKKVEARNFDMRKNTLKYDDVMNDQRKEVYAQRREYMSMEDVSPIIADMRADVIHDMVERYIPERSFAEQWDKDGLSAAIMTELCLTLPIDEWAAEDGMDATSVAERIEQAASQAQASKAANFGPSIMRYVEKQVLLTTFDAVWKEHLLALDQLRQGIGLRAYGQKDPLNEFKHEAFELFNAMLDHLRLRVTSTMARVEVAPPAIDNPFAGVAAEVHSDPRVPGLENEPGPGLLADANGKVPDLAMAEPIGAAAIMPDDPSSWGEVPRNAMCPCGSGRKYKHCHGRLA